jgi:putative flavoprotein involved in K+ transport
MSDEKVETLIIGGGQAGLALSEQLSKRGLPHLVVERYRIVERWRTERWDGLHANGPAWISCMAGFPFRGVEPDGFPTRDQIVHYVTAYAEAIAAPVRCGVAVTRLHRQDSGIGFRAETSQWTFVANSVIAATGPFQLPFYPSIVPPEAGIFQVHASGYRNPEQLPEGAVLVVGAGASGAQFADELLRANRHVFLSVGMFGHRGAIGGKTSYGGWMRLACGTPRPKIRRKRTSRSRSAAPTAVRPLISDASRTVEWCYWAG